MTVAVIGAGFAGLACAGALTAAGFEVSLFDKGRGPAGRASTRRERLPDGRTLRFDHGLQSFRVETPAFAAAVADWVDAGLVAPWGPPGEPGLFTPLTAANAPAAALAASLDVRWGVEVSPPAAQAEGWRLDSAEGEALGLFDAVISAAPAPQTARLLAGAAPALSAAAEAARYAPCWTLMAAWETRPAGLPDAWADSVFAFAMFEDAKPDREGSPSRLTAQASADWTRAHIELAKEDAATALLAQISAPPPLCRAAHRWLFALVAQAADTGGALRLWDPDARIGAAGDWCVPAAATDRRLGVESAWLSGVAAADAVSGLWAGK